MIRTLSIGGLLAVIGLILFGCKSRLDDVVPPMVPEDTNETAGTFRVEISSSVVQAAPGTRCRIPVRIVRNGYDGPIAIEFKGLPAGTWALKNTIQSAHDAGELELVVESGATATATGQAAVVGTPVVPVIHPLRGLAVSSEPFSIQIVGRASSPAATGQQPSIMGEQKDIDKGGRSPRAGKFRGPAT
jgi:hypothetical protein